MRKSTNVSLADLLIPPTNVWIVFQASVRSPFVLMLWPRRICSYLDLSLLGGSIRASYRALCASREVSFSGLSNSALSARVSLP